MGVSMPKNVTSMPIHGGCQGEIRSFSGAPVDVKNENPRESYLCLPGGYPKGGDQRGPDAFAGPRFPAIGILSAKQRSHFSRHPGSLGCRAHLTDIQSFTRNAISS